MSLCGASVWRRRSPPVSSRSNHGCLEDARSLPQDSDRSVAVHRHGRLALDGHRHRDALVVPGVTTWRLLSAVVLYSVRSITPYHTWVGVVVTCSERSKAMPVRGLFCGPSQPPGALTGSGRYRRRLCLSGAWLQRHGTCRRNANLTNINVSFCSKISCLVLSSVSPWFSVLLVVAGPRIRRWSCIHSSLPRSKATSWWTTLRRPRQARSHCVCYCVCMCAYVCLCWSILQSCGFRRWAMVVLCLLRNEVFQNNPHKASHFARALLYY